MLTVLSVIGTRPEAIKMSPVIKELERHPYRIRSVVCSTGQHREMLDQVLRFFEIRPDIELNLMRVNQGLAPLTARLISAFDSVMEETKPDVVLAQGDTTSVLAASLVAFYRGVTFGHIEAGLRTADRRQPFPEEINRRLADAVSDLYFAPTERARQALLREGSAPARIHMTGNTVIDALIEAARRPYDRANSPLAALDPSRRMVLITAHRRESFGEQFRQLCLGIRDLAERFAPEGVQFVYPVHLNPNVRGPVGEILYGVSNVTLLEPLDYPSLIQLMKRAALILTDSGGIQEEAPSLAVPVLVMRETTERPEAIEAGVAKLVGTDRESIVREATRLLRDPVAHAEMATGANPYGDGKAAKRIVDILLHVHDDETRRDSRQLDVVAAD